MNIHIALYKWKKDTSAEDIADITALIEGLADKVPGIVEIACRPNSSKYADGYTHVILVRGNDQAAIDAYRAHPDHVVVAQKIESMEDYGIGVDFSTS